MNVNQVLEGTLSPDVNIRTEAEKQLATAAETNFTDYLVILAKELANENAAPHIRTAAGIALKNAFSFKDAAKLQQVQHRWAVELPANIKTGVKELALTTLRSNDARAGQSAAQFIASIAAIELARDEWQELMPTLVQNVSQGADHHKQASLTCIGFICASEEPELRKKLSEHSNAILTAVVQGARKEETNGDVRYAAMVALSDAIDFVRLNFENEGERNYIMQVVCEATQADDTRIQAAAFGCLNRIMSLYYDKMSFYMEKALFGLTILGMKNEEDDVAKLAIEFWCTVCEEEISIEDDNAAAAAAGSTEVRPFFNFARIACREVVPVLLQLMTTQDEDSTDDDYDTSRAAYQALQLYSQCVGNEIIPPVLEFVEANLRNDNWHYRDAAVAAFGAIMDGPEFQTLEPLVKQALPVLINMMADPDVHVKDSAAYALGRICDYCSDAIDQENHLQPLIACLFHGLASTSKIAGSCCWALMNLTDRFAGEVGAETNPLSKHYQDSISALLQLTEKNDTDNHLRTAAYEVLNSFVTNSATDSLFLINSLSEVVLTRLETTVTLQQQVVSVEDRITLEEMQTSLASVLLAIIQRLEVEIRPQADRIMTALIQILASVPPKSSVPDTVFAAIGALANALEADFAVYMDAFTPFLFGALGSQTESGLSSMAIGLVSDIVRALNDKVAPYCDSIMNLLRGNLSNPALSNTLKPAILETFGDIAQAIGTAFDPYLEYTAQVLAEASAVSASTDVSFDVLDYIVSIREAILAAWGGILLAYKGTPQISNLQRPYIESIFKLLQIIEQDKNRTEGLLSAAMGVIGDIAEAFPNGEFAATFHGEYIINLIRDARTNKAFGPRTIDTARWAREQVKRQRALAPAGAM
ncbi:karyopherin beta [Ascosphaera pollenicola]|nr:karyopherin beta [Ascosphaera pollenicola]